MPLDYRKSENPNNNRRRSAMPARESFLHSQGVPLTYTLLTGVDVVIRQGCVMDALNGRMLAGSKDAAQYLLDFAILTTEQRGWMYDVGRCIFPTCGNQPMSREYVAQNKMG